MSSRLICSPPRSVTTSSDLSVVPCADPSLLPPKKVTSRARTSTLLRFCPSCSQERDCRLPVINTGRPLVTYCATFSPVVPHATTSTKSAFDCHSPLASLYERFSANVKLQTLCPLG